MCRSIVFKPVLRCRGAVGSSSFHFCELRSNCPTGLHTTFKDAGISAWVSIYNDFACFLHVFWPVSTFDLIDDPQWPQYTAALGKVVSSSRRPTWPVYRLSASTSSIEIFSNYPQQKQKLQYIAESQHEDVRIGYPPTNLSYRWRCVRHAAESKLEYWWRWIILATLTYLRQVPQVSWQNMINFVRRFKTSYVNNRKQSCMTNVELIRYQHTELNRIHTAYTQSYFIHRSRC